MSRKTLLKKLAKWQRVLRLQDWQIALGKVGTNPNSGAGAVASMEMDDQYKQGTLYLGKEAFNAEKYGAIDETIIHELLHAHFMSFEERRPSKAGQRAMEQVLNILSKVIYESSKV